MKRPVLILVATLCMFFACPLFAAGTDEQISENMLLKAELELAKKPANYLIFDLIHKKILLKASGVSLKEFPVERISVWGSPVRIRPLPLKSKSTLFKPRRTKIRPGQDKEGGAQEFDALEVKDMPARYRFDLEGDVSIYIRPRPEGIVSGAFYYLGKLKSWIFRPAALVWQALRGKTYTRVDIALNEADARALYWAFPEGTSCVPYYYVE